MPRNQKGSVAIPLVLIGLFVFVIITMVNANQRRRLQDAADAGSIVHSDQLQAVFDNYAGRHGYYPDSAEFAGLMKTLKPLYPGLLNTHSCLPTEPRFVPTAEPGAIVISVSDDGCSDTIRVIGTHRTVIRTIIRRVRGGTMIYGGKPRCPESGWRKFNPFPHG